MLKTRWDIQQPPLDILSCLNTTVDGHQLTIYFPKEDVYFFQTNQKKKKIRYQKGYVIPFGLHARK